MDWTVKFDARAFLELQKLDRTAQTRIASFLKHRIAGGSDPRKPGKALVGEMKGLWRYRIGDYRAVARSAMSSIRCVFCESLIVKMFIAELFTCHRLFLPLFGSLCIGRLAQKVPKRSGSVDLFAFAPNR